MIRGAEGAAAPGHVQPGSRDRSATSRNSRCIEASSVSRFARTALTRERSDPAGVDVVLTLTLLARALERIGDLCTNIAEDIVFLCTGDIVRHARTRDGVKE